MKRSLAFVFLWLTACGPGEIGSGRLVSADYSVTGTRAVTNHSSIPILVYEGPQHYAVLTLDDNLHHAVSISVTDGMLELRSIGSFQHSSGAVLEVTVPHLEHLATDASGDVIGGPFHAREDKVVAHSSGSGEVIWVGNADEVDAYVTGSGSVRLYGIGDEAELLKAETSGSGDIDAFELVAHDARLTTSGSGSVFATLGGGSLSLYLSGSGDIEWYGPAVIVELLDTGSGHIVHHP